MVRTKRGAIIGAFTAVALVAAVTAASTPVGAKPTLSVSVPVSERLFGQGAIGTWNKFVVTTKSG